MSFKRRHRRLQTRRRFQPFRTETFSPREQIAAQRKEACFMLGKKTLQGRIDILCLKWTKHEVNPRGLSWRGGLPCWQQCHKHDARNTGKRKHHPEPAAPAARRDRKSTRLNSSHV